MTGVSEMANQRGRPPKRKTTFVSFGAPRQKTHIDEEDRQRFADQGMHLAFLLESQLYDAINAGYEKVTREEMEGEVGEAELHAVNGDLGSYVSIPGNRAVGRDREERLYLMKIPQSLWEKQQLDREEKARLSEEAINGGSVGAGVEQGYLKPSHGVNRRAG